MNIFKTLIIALTLLAVTAGCNKKKSSSSSLPNPAGAICDVLVVLNEESWKAELGKTYKEVLEDQYPYLPQAEPSFKVNHVTKDVFASTAQKYRNLIINKFGAEYKEPKFIIQKDVYASSQVVITVQAPSPQEAAIYVKENGARLREIFDQTEKDRYAAVVKSSALAELTAAVKEKFGFELFFPSGYALRTSKPNFMWLSLETNYSSQGLLIFTSSYKSERDLSDKGIIAVTDELMKQYVPGPSEGSYMITENMVPPKAEKVTYKGREWVRMRGYWDVEKEFMGGPFISYSTLIKEKNEVLTIRAYVYSPKKDKRKPLLQTEAIIFNLDLDGK